MPRLPTSADFKRETPNVQGGIASYVPDRTGSSEVRMGTVLQDMGSAIDEYSDKIDRVNANEALIELRKSRDEMTFGDNGYTKIKGGDTQKKQIVKTFPEDFQKRRNDIAGKLSTSRARQYFLDKSAADTVTFQSNVLKHATVQTEAHAKAVFEQGLEQNVNAAAIDWNNPDSIDARKIDSAQNIQDRYSEFGMEDLADTAIKANNAKIDTVVIQSALQNNDIEYAMKVFEAGKENFDANTALKIKAAIDGRNDVVEVNNAATLEVRKTLDLYKVSEGIGKPVERTLKEVNDSLKKMFPKDTSKQRQALREYQTQVGIEKTLIEQKKAEEKTWLYEKIYNAAGNGTKDPEIQNVLSVLPKDEREKLLEYNQKISNAGRETDFSVYADVKERIYRGDETLNILEYADKLSVNDVNDLSALQKADGKTINEFLTLDNQIAATIEELNIPKSFDAKFKKEVKALLDAEYPDKKADQKQRQQVIDRKVMDYVEKGFFIDTHVKEFQLTEKQKRSGKFKANIPKAARDRLTADISRVLGVPIEAIPEDQLVKIWTLKGKPQE